MKIVSAAIKFNNGLIMSLPARHGIMILFAIHAKMG